MPFSVFNWLTAHFGSSACMRGKLCVLDQTSCRVFWRPNGPIV